MMDRVKAAMYGAAGSLALAAPAFADYHTGVEIDTAPALAIVTLVLGGLAVFWGVRKAIKVTNKS